MKVDELFARCERLAGSEPAPPAIHYMHQTLVLACSEALTGTRQGFGSLFAQVDYLCKRHGIGMADRIGVQLMRRHSNGSDTVTAEHWAYDVRALARFIQAIFHTGIPDRLTAVLPHQDRPVEAYAKVNLRYLRCVVTEWDDQHIYATTDEGDICVNTDDASLKELLAKGMQLNLLDCTREGISIVPGLVVVEPDFLVDISSVAACFQDYGHHPAAYLLNRLKARANSQPILLGNFAGTALDDCINKPDSSFADSLNSSFSEQMLSFSTCPDFDASSFKADALQQARHISEAVGILFGADADGGYLRSRALVEPSFVCEKLGLQGRVDLMTDDMRLLVEQKSGRNRNIDHPSPYNRYPYQEAHYVQLLLYYGVLRYNFRLPADRVDIRLLYSKYPPKQGLLVVNFYQQLFREAIRQRNRIVAKEIQMAREGFGTVMSSLQAGMLLEEMSHANFFNRYIRPATEALLLPFHQLTDTEHDYVERMMTFVLREQLAQKTGVREGQGGAAADLWNMPVSEKRETGNLLTGHISGTDAACQQVTIALDAPEELTAVPNFRRGDMVYLYRYTDTPNVCTSILYKGVVARLTSGSVTIRLNERQQNKDAFGQGPYAVEHAMSDTGTTAAMRSLTAFCAAPKERRDLLLGLRAPRRDGRRTLSHPYHPHYDDVLLKARQASDYFLLQGPPGTGKTSMALRFLVDDELNQTAAAPHAGDTTAGSLLLMSYTNRAVDEICGMLDAAGYDYLRLGNEMACEPRYAPHLLSKVLGSAPKLHDIRRRLQATRIIVGTTSTLQSQPFIFQLKHFSLAIVDEASQILEPNIIGLLASERIDRFILIGDHKQLPAVVQQPDDEPRLHQCRQSLFERLLHVERAAGRTMFTGILRRQGRMHPDIAAFPNELFYSREQLVCVPCPHQEEPRLAYDAPSADDTDEVLKQHRVLFFPCQPADSDSVMRSDKVNAAEARLVADLLRRLYRQFPLFDAERTVGVIVPYRNQIAMIRHEIELLGIPSLHDITIDTVERYQGSQRDVIIYSFTISQPYQLEFLTQNCFEEDGRTIDPKLNVAMTRARKQLLMTGNPGILQQNAIFARLIARYSVKNA